MIKETPPKNKSKQSFDWNQFMHRFDTLSEVRMAGVLDEFSEACFSSVCHLENLHAENWHQQILEFRPHILFIESAWQGLDGSWDKLLAPVSKVIKSLIKYCQRHGIPTVFWNKEDPVHFDKFIEVAKLVDLVLTTDADIIPHYCHFLGHNRVEFMPFAVASDLHNPFETYDRKKGAVFAGSYGFHYKERQKNLSDIFSSLTALGLDFDIYDRNFESDNENTKFPENFSNAVKGKLAYADIDKAYKGYEIGINANTVKYSASMFSRRTFELMACGTLVLSNYSRAQQLLLGDLLIAGDDRSSLIKRLDKELSDPHNLERLKVLALRKVLDEHTFEHRLALLFNYLNVTHLKPRTVKIGVIARLEAAKDFRVLFQAIKRQSTVPTCLMIDEDGSYQLDAGDTAMFKQLNIAVYSSTGHTMKDFSSAVDYVSSFNARDYYGPNYLKDLVNALKCGPFDVVQKGAYYRFDGDRLCRCDGPIYRKAIQNIVPRRGLIRSTLAQKLGINRLLKSGTIDVPGDIKGVLLDPYNYCEDGSSAGLERLALCLDRTDLDTGLSWEQYFDVIRNGYKTAQISLRSKSASLPLDLLYESVNVIGDEVATFHVEDKEIIIKSDGRSDQVVRFHPHQKIRLSKSKPDFIELKPDQEHKNGEAIHFGMVIKYDEDDNRIGSVPILNRTLGLMTVPSEMIRFRYSQFIAGKGEVVVKSVRIKEWFIKGKPHYFLVPGHLVVTGKDLETSVCTGIAHRHALAVEELGHGLSTEIICPKEPEKPFVPYGVGVQTGDYRSYSASMITSEMRPKIITVVQPTQAIWSLISKLAIRDTVHILVAASILTSEHGLWRMMINAQLPGLKFAFFTKRDVQRMEKGLNVKFDSEQVIILPALKSQTETNKPLEAVG